MNEVGFVSQLEDIAFNKFGENYMEMVAQESGFSRNNVERIFRNKYKLKLKDFIVLCESLDMQLELNKVKTVKPYPEIVEDKSITGDDIVEYKKE